MEKDEIKDETNFSATTALCLAAMTMVGIDGEFQEQELERLRSFIRNDEMSFLKAFEFYNSHPLETCIHIVAAKLTYEQKQATYILLNSLIHADGTIAPEETQLLQQYAEKFGFSMQTSNELQHKTFAPEILEIFS
jgi:uncharacterized tellurite resistance protein B-like protein